MQATWLGSLVGSSSSVSPSPSKQRHPDFMAEESDPLLIHTAVAGGAAGSRPNGGGGTGSTASDAGGRSGRMQERIDSKLVKLKPADLQRMVRPPTQCSTPATQLSYHLAFHLINLNPPYSASPCKFLVSSEDRVQGGEYRPVPLINPDWDVLI